MKNNKINIDFLLLLGVGVFGFATIFSNLLVKYNKFVTDIISESFINEAEILKCEQEIKFIKYGKKNIKTINKQVVIDSNNNGVFDANDVVIDGKLFNHFLPEKGDKVLYLQNKHNIILLAFQNGTGKYFILGKPSEFYGKKAKELDEKVELIVASKNKLK